MKNLDALMIEMVDKFTDDAFYILYDKFNFDRNQSLEIISYIEITKELNNGISFCVKFQFADIDYQTFVSKTTIKERFQQFMDLFEKYMDENWWMLL